MAVAIALTMPVFGAGAQLRSQTAVSATAGTGEVAPLRNSISVMGGAFTYEQGGPEHYPYATLRLGRDLSRFFAGELGFGYADVNTTRFTPTSQEFSFRTPVVMGDLALHAMLPLRAFVPYVGVSAGLFHRFDSRSGITPGEDTQGTSIGVLAGSKLHLGDLFGLRGELRIRGDKHSGRSMVADAEYSFGMVFRF
jgi:hypothetical protein